MTYFLEANPTARGHARQCKALRYRAKDPLTGERIRCGKYALRGGDYCRYHQMHRDRCKQRAGHRDLLGNTGAKNNDDRYCTVPAGYMALSQTLRERLAELENLNPVELIDLTEELKLAKSTMGDVKQLYDLSLLAAEQAPPEKQIQCLQAAISVGGMLRDVASDIGEIAGKAAGAMVAQRSFIGVQNIPLLVNQIIGIMYDELGDEHSQTVARIAERVKDVRLPNDGPRGTRMTPELADQEAAMMDSSVPFVAHEPKEDEDAA